MTDYIIRATAGNNQIRAFAATTKQLVERARSAHNTSPIATAALGRLLTGAAMMGVTMKGEKDLLTIKIQCEGEIKGLTVTADAFGNVKGYVLNPMVMLPPNKDGKLDVGGALDLGVLSVMKDIGLKEPYVGQTILVTGEIAEDLTYYYATSEQTPSSIGLGVLMNKDNTVSQAGGFMIQLLPGADESVITALEEKLSSVNSVTKLMELGGTPESILTTLLSDFGLEIMDKIPTKFACNCTKERVEKALISIGKADLQEIIEDGKPIEMNCHFCNHNYEFLIDELKLLYEKV